MEKKIIVIPDVHGRTFWEDAVKYGIENNIKVIFLGDYLDPYSSEGITPEDALTIFTKILQLKADNDELVTLLLGNHDLEYWNNKMAACRYDAKNARLINELFMDDKENFKIVDEANIANKHFVFSHAGITNAWLNESFPTFPEGFELKCDTINKLFHEDKLWGKLSEVSFIRGGNTDFGSMVWADLREHIKGKQIEDFIQVFGHTQLRVPGVNFNDFTICVDCRQAFYIDENGVVRNYNTDQEVEKREI